MWIFIPSTDKENIKRPIYDFDDKNPIILSELYYIKDNFEETIYKEKLPEKEIFTIDEFSDEYLYDSKIPKDLDDWVRVERLWDWYKLITSIANPTEIIKRWSEIEKQAILKTTSIYNPDKVNPMLHWELATYYLSLNYDTVRLALTTEIDFDKDWNFLAIDMYRSRVKNICMFNYNLFTENLTQRKSDFFYEVQLMNELRGVLNKKRERDWLWKDFEDARRTIWYNKNKSTHIASQFIEEAMIATNMYVAKYLHSNNINAIFRNHMPESIWKEFEWNKMLRAFYSAMNEGHFALGLEYYMHFTSPIRRIVDYISHIVINNFLKWEEQEISNKETFDLCDFINKRQDFILSIKPDNKDKEIDKKNILNTKDIWELSIEDFNINLENILKSNKKITEEYYKEINKRLYKGNYNWDLLAILILSWDDKVQNRVLEFLKEKSYNMFLKKYIDNNLRNYSIKSIKKENTNKNIKEEKNNNSIKYNFYQFNWWKEKLVYSSPDFSNKKYSNYWIMNFIIKSKINYLK